MKFTIQKEGWPPHYLECDEDVMVLSRTELWCGTFEAKP